MHFLYKRDGDSSGATLVLRRAGPGPEQKLVEAAVGPEIDEADEDISEPSLRIDAGQFGCFNE
jgi:hypothetical protein